eukprot:GFKZ01001437.1.p1 GENE.GFKZ01001437.1~~GFKZ01001437.1.p1  ORF type:complete len:413 (+),score=37.08 GFKZ01001437.1:257-1495(+)
MSDLECIGQPLGGIDSLAAAVVSLPTALALAAIFLAAIQGVLTMESADPCRLSQRKMNILLLFEFAEIIVSLTSEALSFIELRASLRQRLTDLHWIAPCLLATGIIETLVNTYFTFAVVTKSRIGWMPFSASGSSNEWWEVLPFGVTASLSCALVGWRLRWWWTGVGVSGAEAQAAIENEAALEIGVIGFSVGWAVGISSLVLIIIFLTDCAEDGAKYVASLPYLWRPDDWLQGQQNDIRVWYRTVEVEQGLQQYIAAAVLDGRLDLPKDERDVVQNLERYPLHCGNAIVGTDRDHVNDEDRASSRLHKVILVAEHLVVFPLLVVVVVLLSRLHDSLDCETFEVMRQLADAVTILAFLEIAIGVKNVLWSISGTSRKERGVAPGDERLQELHTFYQRMLCSGEDTGSTDETP